MNDQEALDCCTRLHSMVAELLVQTTRIKNNQRYTGRLRLAMILRLLLRLTPQLEMILRDFHYSEMERKKR